MKEVAELWLEISGLNGDVAIDEAIRSTRFAGETKLIVDKEIGLGPLMRLIVLREVLSQAGGYEVFYAEARRRASPKLLPNTDSLRHWFQVNGSNKTTERLLTRVTLADFFVAWLHAKHPQTRKHVDAYSLFRLPFRGPGALDEYREWIEHGSRAKTVTGLLPSGRRFVDDKDPTRKARMAIATDILYSSRPHPIILNLFQRGMQSGLTAASGALIKAQPQGDEKRILYLPLRQVSETYSAPSLERILGYLLAFLEGRDVVSAKAIDPSDVVTTIQRLRHHMADEPVIIVLDGYQPATGKYPYIERTMRDDHILELIHALAEPPIGDATTWIDLDRYGKNRIVVTSDGPVAEIPAAQRLEVPLPSEDDFDQVFVEQKFAHGDVVRELLEEHADIAKSRSDTILYLLDALVAAECGKGTSKREEVIEACSALLDAADTVEDDDEGIDAQTSRVANALFDSWMRQYPACYEILVLIALAPEGLREETLTRLVAAMARSRGVRSSRFKLLAKQGNVAPLLKTICDLGGNFMTWRSEGMVGVDDHLHPTEFSVRRVRSASLISADSLDFAHGVARKVLRARSRGEDFRQTIQPYLRILAEEALTQQTISFRHQGPSSSARDCRRLVAGIYYGAQSLPFDSEGRLARAKSIQNPEFAIPETPQDAWDWLYLFAYRRILEAPPAWSLSRHFGMDRLKNDVLKFVDRPWSVWPAGSAPGGDNGVLDRMPSSSRHHELQLDYELARAQAASAIGNLADARIALGRAHAAAERQLDREQSKRLSEVKKWLPNPRIQKRQIDLALVDERFAQVRRFVQPLEGGLRKSVPDVAAYLDEINAALQNLVGKANFSDVIEGLPPAIPATRALSAYLLSLDVPGYTLSHMSGLLFRVGEYHALTADLANSEVRKEEIRLSERLGPEAYEAAAKMFCKSMSCFRLAEACRLQVFAEHPTGSNFFANGHSARQMVRVALKLEQLARRHVAPGMVSAGFFARRARHTANVLTRHLFSFPRDRASMLILESTIARLLSPAGSDAIESLENARQFLHQAEALVQRMGSGTRVRMRLMLERIKVHRRLASEYASIDSWKSALFLRYARHDLSTLSELNSQARLKLWKYLIEIQDLSLSALAGQLGEA